MIKLKRIRKNTLGAISTASLPDIVFMLLFFFMVTTVMRNVDLKVHIKAPTASEVKKLEDRSLVSYIYVGTPVDTVKYGTLSRIQMNDAFAEPSLIREFIAAKMKPVNEDEWNKMTVSLKVDRNTEMGIVMDVKQELRKASALKINYSSFEGDPVRILKTK